MPQPYVETQLKEAAAAGVTQLKVLSTAGMSAGYHIGIQTDAAGYFWTLIGEVVDTDTLNLTVSLSSGASRQNLVLTYQSPDPKPPASYQRLIQAPNAQTMTSDEMTRWLYDMWQRTGGAYSYVTNLQGLRASVTELNYSVGVTSEIQTQLNSKASTASLGTMSTQNANNVSITGGSIAGVVFSSPTATLSGGSITNMSISVKIGNTSISRKVSSLLLGDPMTYQNSGSSETDFTNYTIPADALSTNGDTLELVAWGTFAANANNKRIRLYFDATVAFDSGTAAINNGFWLLRAEVIRVTSASARCAIQIKTSGGTFTTELNLATISTALSNAIVIRLTGEATSNNDISQLGFRLSINPYT